MTRAFSVLALAGVLVACVEDPVADPDTDAAGATPDGGADTDASTGEVPDASTPDPDMSVDPDPDAAVEIMCVEDADCPAGATCLADGVCTIPECIADGDCGSMLRTCRDGFCRDRCLGPGTCIRGGICVDGACEPPECEADEDCGEGLLCRDDACVEARPCGGNDECGEDESCEAGNCEALPRCGGDANCEGDEICQDGRCREQTGCEGRDECAADQDCVAGRCVPFICRGDVDCGGAEVCNAGVCEAPAEVEVARVVILSRPRTLTVGESVRLRAAALDLRGDIVATRGFLWSGDADGVLDVNAATGEVTGGPGAGAGNVVAAFPQPGGELLASDPLPLRVVEAVEPEGLRVLVTSAGAPLEGATVRAGDEVALTDADGVAAFDAAGAVTVFADDHDFVSLVGLQADSVHVPLTPRSDDVLVAGFTGAISFDDVTSMGGVDLGLAGASIGGGLTHLGFAQLVGELFNSAINAGPVSTDIPLPGGITLSADVPILGRVEVKDRYYATAGPGLRVGWAFAGRIDVGVVFGLVGGGGFDAGSVLATLLPFFDSFEHGLRVAEDLRALPRLADDDDVDGDGDNEELVPDYERFPVLDNEPAQAQQLRMGVTLPAPPEGATALLFAGVEVGQVGFVPMGVTAATEAGDLPMRMAAPYGGLEAGEPVVLALAGEFGGGGGGLSVPEDVSAVLGRWAERFPNEVVFGDFLAHADAVEWDPAVRAVAGGAVDGATLHRVVFRGGTGRWTVYVAGGEAPEWTLPVPPEGMPDLAGGATEVRFEGLRLRAGGLDDFASLGGGDLLDLDRETEAFSRVVR